MRIVYLHGRRSSPRSYKCQVIRAAGHDVMAPELPPDDWAQSIINAREAIQGFAPDVVVGSSRGGAVAMMSNRLIPMILVAPAWKKYCPWGTIAGSATVIHSPGDEIVEFGDSIELAHAFGAMLIEAGHDHRMNDNETIQVILGAINENR